MNPTESGVDDVQSRRERLSALMDGEIDAAGTDSCCLQWRDEAEVRASWHAYHLIGDMLRSEKTACAVPREVRLLQAVRRQLADEPVVLAPTAPVEPAHRRRGWLAPAAVVAGFMAVASVVGIVQAPLPTPAAGIVSAGSREGAEVSQAALFAKAPEVAPTPADPLPMSADSRTLRDERLDRYLTAHKQFGGSSALGVPSGFLRAATVQAPAR